jgi:hypothetical protein
VHKTEGNSESFREQAEGNEDSPEVWVQIESLFSFILCLKSAAASN